MSTPINVQCDEITLVAANYDATADVIDTVGQGVQQCMFYGPMAGRDYADSGAAVHGAYLKLVTSLQEWTTQAHGVATAVRYAADGYRARDQHTASTLQAQP